MSAHKTMLLPLLTVFLLLAASALFAATTVLNFDDLSGPGTLTNYGGLQWGPNWGYYEWVQGGAYSPHSGLERAYPTVNTGSWTFTFPTPQVFAGAYFDGAGDASNPTVTFNLYTLVNGVPTYHSSSVALTLSTSPTLLPSGCADPVIMVEVVSDTLRWTMDDVTFSDPAPTVLTVPIDISPRDSRNVIDLNDDGLVTVAILSTTTFDATTVDPKSVVFAGAKAIHAHVRKANRDHLKDLILQFRISDLQIRASATSATLTGTTTSGQAIQGTDSVQVIAEHHCGKK